MSKRLETLATVVCMKSILMLFNVIFWVAGILMLCTGIWLRLQLQDYIGINTEGSSAILLVIASFGAILVLAATLACCCTTRGHPALLYLYGAFLSVVAILELGAGASIYAYRSTLHEGFDQAVNESMIVYGENALKSNHLDMMQSTLQCCGNKGFNDWYNIYPQKEIPFSCCKVPKDECDINNTDQIYIQGCYTRAMELINGKFGLLIGTATGVAFLVVGVLLACCLASNVNKANYLL